MAHRDSAEALVALLAQPDPPDLRTPDGVGRSFRPALAGHVDRHHMLAHQAVVYLTNVLVDRDNERLQ